MKTICAMVLASMAAASVGCGPVASSRPPAQTPNKPSEASASDSSHPVVAPTKRGVIVPSDTGIGSGSSPSGSGTTTGTGSGKTGPSIGSGPPGSGGN